MQTTKRPFFIGMATAGVMLVISLAYAGMGGTSPANADEDTSGGEPTASYSDFTDRNTGLFPDIQKNSTYQNSGNRGCVSCHQDLFDVDASNGTYAHITTYAGLKNGTYVADCQTCHSLNIGTTGNIMSENIHVSHYSNQAFLDLNGNCWSCHATTKNAEGEIELVMYEELQYEIGYGGYTFDDSTTEKNVGWAQDRGWDTGYLSGISVDSDPAITVSLDQTANEEANEFICTNYVRLDGNDAYAAIDPETWTLEITGVNSPTVFTLDDLKAMPAVEKNVAQWCAANGINSAMVDNMPVEGVLLEDLIAACGGLADGNNAAYFIAADGWYPSIEGVSIQDLIDSNTLIVFGNYGHDLTTMQGGPAKLLIPSAAGALSVKNLVGIDFEAVDEPVVLGSDSGIYPINTSWFVNDGVQAKVGEQISIEGASYGFSSSQLDVHPTQLQFSLDYGTTWTTVDVPEDFDPQQWVHFTFNWTPTESGTYILKARAIGVDGTEQVSPSNLIVVVSD